MVKIEIYAGGKHPTSLDSVRAGLRSMEFLCLVCALSNKSWLPGFRQLPVWRVSTPLNISTAAAPVHNPQIQTLKSQIAQVGKFWRLLMGECSYHSLEAQMDG
jgi:hypothetical protein